MIRSQRGIFEQRQEVRHEVGNRGDCGRESLKKEEASIKALRQKHVCCDLGTFTGQM